jgi:predicted nucleic acid-binding protein
VIVVDASAILEVLLRTPSHAPIEERIFAPEVTLHAPHLVDIEVAQVLRRIVRSGKMSDRRGKEALEDFRGLAITRYPHHVLMERIWELRLNLTAYDAAYVSLAEALDATLITCDKGIAGAPGINVTVELVG